MAAAGKAARAQKAWRFTWCFRDPANERRTWRWAKPPHDFKALADCWYPVEDIGCRLASGSFPTAAMVIAPCSIHTMSAIAAGISSNLMVRAADVTLKERRRLVLMVRESPLHLGHLRSMTALAEMGAIVAPPMPAFYHHPQTVADIVEHSVDRVLDLMGLPAAGRAPVGWTGRSEGRIPGRAGRVQPAGHSQLLGPRAKPEPRQRFDEVFAALRAGEVDAAALPIENTLAGSVHENYDLLLKYDFEITAETSVRIVHNLIAPPGVEVRAIRKVYSHPVALNQCLDFFARHKRIERIPYYDTAGSVKMVMAERPEGAAAIASELAAKNLRRPNSEARNRRRPAEFHAIFPAGAGRREAARPARDAGQVAVENVAGVFDRTTGQGPCIGRLSALALRDLNLVKIESRPRRGKPWEYMFYLDLLAHRDEPRVRNALGHLTELADFLRVLGTYRAAR